MLVNNWVIPKHLCLKMQFSPFNLIQFIVLHEEKVKRKLIKFWEKIYLKKCWKHLIKTLLCIFKLRIPVCDSGVFSLSKTSSLTYRARLWTLRKLVYLFMNSINLNSNSTPMCCLSETAIPWCGISQPTNVATKHHTKRSTKESQDL